MRTILVLLLSCLSSWGALSLEYIITGTITNPAYADSGIVGGDKINRNFSNILGGHIPITGVIAPTTVNYTNLSASDMTVFSYLSLGGSYCWLERDGTNHLFTSPTNAVAVLTNNDRLYLGPGTFYVTPYSHAGHPDMELTNWAPMLFKNLTNVSVVGAGPATRLSLTTNGHVIGLSFCSNMVFSDFAIDGLPFTKPIPQETGAYDQYSALITLVGTNRWLRFENLDLKGNQHGISQLWPNKYSMDVWIKNCYFYGFGNTNVYGHLLPDGTAVSGIGSRWNISHCVFDYCCLDIEIESVSYDTLITDCVFENNLHRDNRWVNYAVWPYNNAGRPNIRNVIIANNIMSNKVYVAGIAASSGYGVSMFGGENITIKGNIFAGFRNGNNYGISVPTDSCQLNNVVIADNIFQQIGGPAIAINVGSSAIYPTNVTISGNIFRDIGLNAQSVDLMDLHGYYYQINDNTLIDGTSYAAGYGIRLIDTDYSYIHDNLIVDTRAPTRTQVGIYLNSGSYSNNISHNRMVNVTTNVHNLGQLNNIYQENDYLFATNTLFANLWDIGTIMASNRITVAAGSGGITITPSVSDSNYIFTVSDDDAGNITTYYGMLAITTVQSKSSSSGFGGIGYASGLANGTISTIKSWDHSIVSDGVTANKPNGTLTFSVAGKYRVYYRIQVAPKLGSSMVWYSQVFTNGTAVPWTLSSVFMPTYDGDYVSLADPFYEDMLHLTGDGIIDLLASDYVELRFTPHNSGTDFIRAELIITKL